ncbi:MAG: SLC26A/SulP transporter family protein [Anaerolineales bacterium]
MLTPHKFSIRDMAGELSRDIKSVQILPGFTSGLVVGLVEVIIAISFAALIFTGEISISIATGIGLALIATTINGIVITLLTSLPGTISGIQDAPSAILATLSAALVASMPPGAPEQEVFVTVIMAISITTILCGVFFLAMGYFNLGSLVRFLPYPVVGGFLAGTGWLLVTGSIHMMTDITPSLHKLSSLFQPEILLLWIPGLIFALILLVIMNRYNHYLLLPGLIFGAILSFFLITRLAGFSISDASANGWLLGPFPEGSLIGSLPLSSLLQVNWGLIVRQVGSMVIILVISAISLLLNASGLELEVRADLDLNHELRSAGIANLLGGLFAGFIGYHQLGLSVMNQKLGSKTRLTGLFAAAVCVAALVTGTSLISLFPKFILGGLLLYLGLAFLHEWLYETWFRLPKSDYLVILLILFVIASVGFLEGVAIGILAAVILFAVNYSRIDVIKHSLTAATYQSTISRPKLQRRLLQRYGNQILIIELQGFIFFGTANQLLEQMRAHINLHARTRLCFMVFDFVHVTGVDSSVLISFQKMIQLINENSSSIVLTGLSKDIEAFLRRSGILSSDEEALIVLPDLDHGVEWCENTLLESTGVLAKDTRKSLPDQLKAVIADSKIVSRIMNYLELQELPAGVHIIQQGDSPGDVYFLEEGFVTAQLEIPGQDPLRLNTLSSENLVGELGFYLGSKRNASVVSDTPIKVFRLTTEALGKMEANDPEAAAEFHKFIVHIMAEKLSHVMSTVESLKR